MEKERFVRRFSVDGKWWYPLTLEGIESALQDNEEHEVKGISNIPLLVADMDE